MFLFVLKRDLRGGRELAPPVQNTEVTNPEAMFFY